MSNGLKQVSALRVDSQVLGGEPTPPSLGVNDYAFRVVPGSEDILVNNIPPELTDIVSGSKINRANVNGDPLLIKDSGGRYGVQLRNSIGYHNNNIGNTNYRTGFAVCKVPINFKPGFFFNLGPFNMYIDPERKFINQDMTNKRNTVAPGAVGEEVGVFTVFARGSKTVSVNPSGLSGTSNYSVENGKSFIFGPANVAEQYKAMYDGVTLYDAVLYDRELSDAEILKVRQSLQNIWNTTSVGTISWSV